MYKRYYRKILILIINSLPYRMYVRSTCSASCLFEIICVFFKFCCSYCCPPFFTSYCSYCLLYALCIVLLSNSLKICWSKKIYCSCSKTRNQFGSSWAEIGFGNMNLPNAAFILSLLRCRAYFENTFFPSFFHLF